jgi:hypothetical protein
MRHRSVWAIGLVGFILLLNIGMVCAQTRVDGYYRKDGTYVQPHSRTTPDGNPYNNYSFPGNYNPNTGQITGGDPNRYLQRYQESQPQPYGLGTPQPQSLPTNDLFTPRTQR